MAAHIVLPWTHRAFALLKRWALGTYHGLRSNHINTYLDEFVFRYNRRFYRHISFETLLGFAVHRDPITYWDIIGRANPRKSRITLKPMIDKDGRHVLNSAKTQDIGEPELTG